MYAQEIKSATLCMGTDFGRYIIFAKIVPPWGTDFGKRGPILAAKVVRGDRFWQVFLPKSIRLDQYGNHFLWNRFLLNFDSNNYCSYHFCAPVTPV